MSKVKDLEEVLLPLAGEKKKLLRGTRPNPTKIQINVASKTEKSSGSCSCPVLRHMGRSANSRTGHDAN